MSGRLVHAALSVESTANLIDAAAAIAEAAVRRADPVLAVFPDEVAARLGERLGPDADALAVEPYDTCYDTAPRAVARFVDTVRGYAARGQRPTVMGGSLLVGRDPDETLSWLQMESVLNHALAAVDALLVCCYPRGDLTPWAAAAAAATHPFLLVDGVAVPSAGYLEPATFLAANPERPGPMLGAPDVEVSFDRSTLRRTRQLVGEYGVRAGLARTAGRISSSRSAKRSPTASSTVPAAAPCGCGRAATRSPARCTTRAC